MKLDKNSIFNLLKKWGSTLSSRIRNASLSSRITGGLLALLLLITIAVPNYAKLLSMYCTLFAALLWMASMLFHAAKRLRSGGVPGRNPFTLPLIAMCLAFVLLLTAGNTNVSYIVNNEPMNQLIEQLQRTVVLPQDKAAAQLQHMGEYFVPHPQFSYNILLLDDENNVLFDKTKWISGGTQTLYPLLSYSPDSVVGMMVLLGENEQVIGTFEVEQGVFAEYGTPSSSASLTLSQDTDNLQTAQGTLERLEKLYFPSFGEVIDEYALQLAVRVDRLVVETNIPYQGELANRLYEYDYDLDILSWNGEKIIDLRSVYQGDNMKYSEQNLIDALNALGDDERAALQTHIRWLQSAWRNAHTGYGQCVQVFENTGGSHKILLLYTDVTSVLYPLSTAASEAEYNRRMLIDIALLFFLPVCWILLAFWVFADAKRRGHKHPAMWGLLTMIGSVVTLIVYNMVRPQLRVDRSGKKQPKGVCPLCGAVLKDDYIACPGCGILLRSRCANCRRALENDWNFCPYCTQQIDRGLLEAPAEGGAADAQEDASAGNDDGEE